MGLFGKSESERMGERFIEDAKAAIKAENHKLSDEEKKAALIEKMKQLDKDIKRRIEERDSDFDRLEQIIHKMKGRSSSQNFIEIDRDIILKELDVFSDIISGLLRHENFRSDARLKYAGEKLSGVITKMKKAELAELHKHFNDISTILGEVYSTIRESILKEDKKSA
jgi:hypothetical protein